VTVPLRAADSCVIDNLVILLGYKFSVSGDTRSTDHRKITVENYQDSPPTTVSFGMVVQFLTCGFGQQTLTGRSILSSVNRRNYLTQAGVAVTAGMLAGCGGLTGGDDESGTTYGTLATSVTDQPTDIADFESCVVTIQGIWITPAGDDGSATETTATNTTTNSTATNSTEVDAESDSMDGESESNGRRYIEFEEPQSADLVDLQGSNSQLLEETEVETGDYQFLQLDVDGVDGTLNDGSEASVETPGNAPLRFNAAFEIREDERTQFIADFTPVRRGNGSYIIQPVATGTTVLYGDEEYTADDASTTAENETMADGGQNETAGGGQSNGSGGQNN